MNKSLIVSIMVCIGLLVAVSGGCTANERARQFGGTLNEKVPTNQKVIGATWKENHLWYLTRPMHSNEVPEVVTLKEQSSWGVLQGTVNFIESK